MEKSQRIELIRNSPTTEEVKSIRYSDGTLLRQVQLIPLNALLYNRYNGRIRSTVLSHEQIFGKLDAGNSHDKVIIEQYLFDSAKNRNDRTIESLEKIGQQEIGIVTKDGVIIDGNRRAMLIGMINAKDNTSIPFKAIVLPDELEENEKDIILLETNYQMGVDSKVDYNPIEKYLRCKELNTKYHFSEEQIGEMMAVSESQIFEWLSILDLMEDYLQRLGTPSVYTRLEKREGHFVDLNGYLKNYLHKRSYSVKWSYEYEDVLQMKRAYFDYIRLGVPVQRARIIGKPGSSNSFFCQKMVWDDFIREHEHITSSVVEKIFSDIKQVEKNKSNEDIFRGLDTQWKEQIGQPLLENLSNAEITLKEYMEIYAPVKILRRVINSLGQVTPDIPDPSQREEAIRLLIIIKEKASNLIDEIQVL